MTVAAEQKTPVSSAQLAYVLLALAGLFWAGNHIAGRAAAGHIPPIFLSCVRWLLGAVALYPFARGHLKDDWPALRAKWKIVLFLAVLASAIFGTLQYVGLQWTTALNVSVFNSFSPVMIAIVGAIAFRDRLSIVQIFGVAVSLTGVLVIVAQGDATTLAGFTFNRGDVIILFNMAIWAVYSTFLRRLPRTHWMSFMFVMTVAGAAATLPFAMVEYALGARFEPSALTFSVIAYVAIVSGIAAFASWNRGVAIIGSNRSGVFLHLVPIYGALLATSLLGERLMAYHIVGFALILSGVFLVARQPRA